jgi:hypothetical protein
MRKRTWIIVAVISTAVAGLGNAQSTPTATAVGPWRTGVSVTCPDGRTIPANTAISGPNVTAAELCGSGSSSSTTSTGGAIISNTGNFKQDMLTNSVNLMIVSKTTNPMVSSFMQGAATSFISSMFANSAEQQRQQQAMNAEILRRQQEAQAEAERQRILQQQRIDAMFARLNRTLKLEGLPFGLSLKPMNTGQDLTLKGMNSSSPDDLKLKMGNSGGYGIQGLPGIYVGGPAGSAANTETAATANSGGADTDGKAYGIQGLPGTYVGGPTGGPAGGPAGDAAANTGGMPGLPGIYLNGVSPSQAPDLAQAAQTLNGPERTLAQDTALQAAQQNPALTAPSQDPRVENFQQANQDYQQALQANASANRDYQTAQAHIEADKSAIEVAQNQLRSITPSVEQQQAFDKMLAAAKTDEDAAALARQGFDSTEIHLSASRDQAAAALAQMGSLPSPNLAARSPNTVDSSAVDLSHTTVGGGTHSGTVPLLRAASPAGGSPRVSAPAALSPAPSTALASTIPVSHVTPAIAPPIDINACLANITHSSVSLDSRPTVEQLHAQLDIAKESLGKLLETHLRENEDREEWAKDMKKGGLDIGYQAFDLTAKMVLGRYITESTKEFTQASQNMRRLQGALATENNLANQATLEAEIGEAIEQRAKAGKAMQLLKQVKEGVEQGATARDFRGWLTDNGEPIAKGNPIEMSKDGSPLPALDGVKQLVKITLSQKSVQDTLQTIAQVDSKVDPFVDRVLTAGNALIDTGYDLTVEYLGFQQLQQADRNSELFYQAAKPLQQKIQVTAAQLKCYQ